MESERNKVPRAGHVSAEVIVHPGNFSPLRAGVFGGWTDALFTLDAKVRAAKMTSLRYSVFHRRARRV